MNAAIDDMRKDGMVFSCLGGQRQRYEYFGFSRAGSKYNFIVEEANIKHTLISRRSAGLSLTQVNAGDSFLLDRIEELHKEKIARCKRPRERLYDILISYTGTILAVKSDEKFLGYLIYRIDNLKIIITEINLTDSSLYPEVLGLFMQECNSGIIKPKKFIVSAGPHETAKITALSGFTEYCEKSPAFQFAVFNFLAFIEPFIKLKSQDNDLAEGSFVIKIEGNGSYELSSRGGKAGINETTSSPDLVLDPLEATRFFFSSVSTVTIPKIRENVFLQSLLPLPLFFENMDGV
jgi:predicted acetyltransferase